MNKNKKILFTVVLTSIFSALVFLSTFISIPIGISKIHLGNIVCILAGLLFGPIVGGLSGSIGMGFNDYAGGYSIDTIIRTVIVKFIVGFLAGLLHKKNNDDNKRNLIFISSIIVLICLVNVILEFILKIPLKMIFLSMNFEGAFTYAVQSLPVAIINSLISSVIIILSNIPLRKIIK